MPKIYTSLLDGMETETYAVISTSHIAESDARLLDQVVSDVEEYNSDLPVGILILSPLWSTRLSSDGSRERYGWRIRHQCDAGEEGLLERMKFSLEEKGFTRPFINLMEALMTSTLSGVVIDQDGPIYDHLYEFDW